MQFFARQVISVVLKSDSGPSFNGIEFKNFAEHLGFRHEAEYFMKTREMRESRHRWAQEVETRTL